MCIEDFAADLKAAVQECEEAGLFPPSSCSNCNLFDEDIIKTDLFESETPYCPNCGAKMDGKEINDGK